MKSAIVAIIIFLSFHASAQKKLSVVYEINNGNKEYKSTQHLLAIDDSVSFSTVIFHRNKKMQPPVPLGSGFESHNTYTDVKRNLVLFQSQPFNGTKYLVSDAIRKTEWTLVDEEKTILGYTCKKAIAYDEERRITVWYTTSLPFSFGLDGATNLPGLTLQFEYKGQPIHTAIKIENDSPEIVEPTQGKKVSIEEFKRIVQELRNKALD